MKLIFYTLFVIFFAETSKGQENYLSILEPAIGVNTSELKLFLKGVLNGREPGKAPNIEKTIYTIDNNDIHAEYFINKDSCLQAAMRFKNEQPFKKAKEFIISNYPQLKGIDDMFYKITQSGRLIYYSIDNQRKLIIIIDNNFFSEQLQSN